MSQEHEELEADWLARELLRIHNSAVDAYEGKDETTQRLHLSYVVSGLDGLISHYQVENANKEAYNGIDLVPAKKIGFWARLAGKDE